MSAHKFLTALDYVLTALMLVLILWTTTAELGLVVAVSLGVSLAIFAFVVLIITRRPKRNATDRSKS